MYVHICLSIYLSIYLFIYLSIYILIYLPTYLFINLCIYLFMYVYIYLYIYLSVCLSIQLVTRGLVASLRRMGHVLFVCVLALIIFAVVGVHCFKVCRSHDYTYMYIHTHTYIHTYTYIHAYIHTYVRTYVQTYIHTYVHTCTYIHTYLHTHTRTYIYIHRDDFSTVQISSSKLKKSVCKLYHIWPHPLIIVLFFLKSGDYFVYPNDDPDCPRVRILLQGLIMYQTLQQRVQ